MNEIFEAICKSAKRIEQAINVKDIGYSQEQNSSGETQLQLDIQCDLIIEEELSRVSSIHTIASEEKEEAMELNPKGQYLIGFDPRFEEAILILRRGHKPALLTGNEGWGFAELCPVEVQKILFQSLSLLGQPRQDSKMLIQVAI